MARAHSGRLALAVVLVAAAAVAVVAATAAALVLGRLAPRGAPVDGAAVDRAHAAFTAGQREGLDRLALAARLLAGEPALAAVLAGGGAGGAAALGDVIAERRDALGIDGALVLDAAGTVVAAGGVATAAPGEELAARPLVARALAEGPARGVWPLDGGLARAAVERVAPEFEPLGWVVALDRVEPLDALDLARATGAVATWVTMERGVPRAVATSLDDGAAAELVDAVGTPGGALARALAEGDPVEIPAVALAAGERRVLVLPLAGEGGPAAVLLSAPAGDSRTGTALFALGAATLVALALAVPLALAVARGTLAPARRLADAVEAAPAESFSRRLEPRRYGAALGPLAAGVDRLFRHLHEERALAAAAGAARRAAPAPPPAAARPATVLAVDLRRLASAGDARETAERLARDRGRIAAAVAAGGGRLAGSAGHRVYALFEGDGAAGRAVAAAATAVVAAGEPDSAFDEGEPPAAAVAAGRVAGGEAGFLAGPGVQLAESLLREAAPGDLVLSRSVERDASDRLAAAGVTASPQQGILGPQPVYVLRDAALAGLAGPPRGHGGGPPVPGALFADRYEVLAREGGGDGVELLRARDRERAEEVALAWIPETTAGGAALEPLDAIGRLAHPNLARTHDAGRAAGGLYLAREWIDGVPLARLGPLSPPALLGVARQLAAALAAVHGEGLAHGRLDAGRVWVEADGRVRVTGLGVALAARLAGAAAGRDADPRADVAAAGALLHGAALGPRPDDPAAAGEPALPPELAAVLARATAAAPADRFADGGELLRALEGVAA